MFRTPLVTSLEFNSLGAERSTFTEQHHVSTSALSRNFELYDVAFLFHGLCIMHKKIFLVNRYLETLAVNKPPKITVAAQVCRVYGIANAGNRVFSAQMVSSGPRINSPTISKITIVSFMIYPKSARICVLYHFYELLSTACFWASIWRCASTLAASDTMLINGRSGYLFRLTC